MQIRVYYEDTDVGGVVYHSNYLNFCERARSELFFNNNMTPALEEGHFVAKSIHAEFLKPARLADLLHVKTKLISMKGASFTLHQAVYKDDERLFEMQIVLAHIDYEGKLIRMSERVKTLLNSFIDHEKL
ncbi:MAG: YbgC/FadM family acyl-CoA thioesterase [Campylobacterota bacterium]|nr:YbgC/FadM family acyl-CoA thioesterase [Campylobacterota bacterium]